MTANDFVIKHTSHGDWIVHHKDRDNHSHFKQRTGCIKLVQMICKGRMPAKDYWVIAAKRVLTDDEFMALQDKRKPHYINIGYKGR